MGWKSVVWPAPKTITNGGAKLVFLPLSSSLSNSLFVHKGGRMERGQAGGRQVLISRCVSPPCLPRPSLERASFGKAGVP